MVIYNARPQQKWLTISGCGALEFLLIFGFFLGEIYKSLKDTLIVLSMMLSVLLIFIITYFLVIKFANSMFIFDETGFVRKMNKKVKKLAFLGLCTSLSLIFAYVEVLIPPLFASVPGIKLGLPNIVIIFILYKLGVGYAAAVSFLRICLASLLFGNPVTFVYSVAGGFLSLLLMAILKKTNKGESP